jgi:inosine/guanosine/xanthosine phosphorylase family protein
MNKSEAEPKRIAQVIERASRLRPKLAIILGTGFHYLAQELAIEKVVPFSKLPGFPRPGVRGHAGELLLADLAGTPVLVLNGRVHYYEGAPMNLITFPVRVLAAYGITDLLLTNAAGGINPRLRAGDFMILSDHINLMGINPLRGTLSQGPPFVDLSCAYDRRLRRLLQQAGKSAGLKVSTGVYLAVSGPSYETPAEIRAFHRLGADAVGMSTVPEVIAARHCGLKVAALSCITNLAAGLSKEPLSHAEVLATAAHVKNPAARLIKHFVRLYAE